MTIRREYLDTPSGQVHLHRAGRGSAVVLLHHAPSSAGCWDPVLPLLADAGVEAIALDLPGFGQSDAPPAAPDLDWYTAWVVNVLAELDFTGPVVMVGRHSGATVAAAVAAAYPDRVNRLLLWAYPWLSDEVMDQLAAESTPPLGPDLAPLHNMVDVLRVLDPIPTSDAEQRRRLADLLRAGPNQNWLHNVVGATDHGALAARVPQPCLFVFDDARHDLGDQHAAGRSSAAQAPRGAFRSVAGLSIGAVDRGAAELAACIAELALDRAGG